MDDCVIACVLQSEGAARESVRRIREAGVPASAIHLGGIPDSGVARLASEIGIQADLDTGDPLRRAPGIQVDGGERRSTDRGGAIGGIVGVLAGTALGLSPWSSVVPVAVVYRLPADMLLLLAIGIVAGAALGNALAPPHSTHVGFRLIDAMEEGGLALLVEAPHAAGVQIERLMRDAGGSCIVRLP